ncbi:MAG: glycosyltransferase [Verrucomicrobiota bacterium]
MKFALFYHTLLSDWNHGNAHFLRGIVSELLSRGHDVRVFEPKDSWSRKHLLAEHGSKPIRKFRAAYPQLESTLYEPRNIDLDKALDGVEAAIVHEWNDPFFVHRIGRHHAKTRKYSLLFHDTHHRMVTDPTSMDAYDLSHFDGVLAYGKVLRNLYLERARTARAWIWHEAADIRVFKPEQEVEKEGDVIWVGNWGDGERTAELERFLIEPVRALALKARVFGVRYPATAQAALAEAGIEYGGWLPNFEVPRTFAQYKLSLHIPRQPYVKALPGIPTIRVFEALACGIPLISSPWSDAEHLFRPGKDFLMARQPAEMRKHIETVLHEPDYAAALAKNGLETIRNRHTCAHRVDELLAICQELK